MKNYAVAILSCFDNNNMISFIEADTPAQALKTALVEQCKDEETKQQQCNWNDTLPNELEELKNELYNGELCCDVKELPATLSDLE